MVNHRCILFCASLAGCLLGQERPISAAGFWYHPPGSLISGSGEGIADCNVHAGFFFPLDGPAYPNSQLYNPGGIFFGTGNESECEPVNRSSPWRDNFCETRGGNPSLPACANGSGGDHAGQDIRSSSCKGSVDAVYAVAAGVVSHVSRVPESKSSWVDITSGDRVYTYLHMEPIYVAKEDTVKRGQMIGQVSDMYLDPNISPPNGYHATTFHLHFEVADQAGKTVSPYMSLVAAYRDMIGKIDIGDTVRATVSTEVRTQIQGGTLVATKTVGQLGGVKSGPQVGPYGGSCALWWLIRWSDGTYGWSVDNGLVEDAPLSQWESDGTTVIPTGGLTADRFPRFKATLTDPEGDNVSLEIELRRLDEYDGGFRGVRTHWSRFVPSGSVAEIRDVPGFSGGVADLIDGSYHWRARMVDVRGNARPWIPFGFNDDAQADFRVGESYCSANSASVVESALAACGGALSVGLSGTGTGRVLSNPAGIDCPGDCTETFASGMQVLLSPRPSPGSTFSAWSGDPDCVDGSVTINGDRSCTATFTATVASYTLTVSKAGSGNVGSSDGGISCGGSCSRTYTAGTTITLAAVAASGWSFSSWSGGCSGGPVIQFPMNANRNCTANFVQSPVTLPETTTGTATGISATSATLNGTVNPHGMATTGFFEYGPEPWMGLASPPRDVGAGTAFLPMSETVSGLTCDTTYRFRMVGVNAAGPYRASNGSFRTAGCPSVPCYTLTLVQNGEGELPVASPTNSSGCPFNKYHAGERITLTASPGPGHIVSGWGGTDNDLSTATVNTAIMPSFDRVMVVSYGRICYHLSLGHTGNGSAPVVIDPVDYCPSGYFPWGYEVRVTASPAAGWQVGQWNGTGNDESEQERNFIMMPIGNHAALVQYVPIPYLLSVAKIGNGTGTVVSDPPGIDCGLTCRGLFPYGSTVTLAATPAPDSTFLGWSGAACNGGVVNMATTTECSVVFSRTPTNFYTLSPCRIVDTRNAQSPSLSGAAPPRFFQLTGNCGVPASARAVSVNVTVVNPTSSGFVVLFPADEPVPGTSTVNFRGGQTRANNAIVKLSADGRLAVIPGIDDTEQLDLLIDINGYFNPAY